MKRLKVAYIGSAEGYRERRDLFDRFTQGRAIDVAAVSFGVPTEEIPSGVAYYSDPYELLEAELFDALILDAHNDTLPLALRAMQNDRAILALAPFSASAEDYARVLEMYAAQEYQKKKLTVALAIPNIADSKIAILKQLLASNRIGAVKRMFVSAQTEFPLNEDIASALAPAALLANEKNALDFSLKSAYVEWYVDTLDKTKMVLNAKLNLEGKTILALITPGKTGKSEIIVEAENGVARWTEEGALTVDYRAGVREQYTYAQTASSLAERIWNRFFLYATKRSPFVYSPLEDAKPLFQFKQCAEALKVDSAVIAFNETSILEPETLAKMKRSFTTFYEAGYSFAYRSKTINP